MEMSIVATNHSEESFKKHFNGSPYMHAAFAYIILFFDTLIFILFSYLYKPKSAILTKFYTSHCLKHKGLHSLHTKHRLNTVHDSC